jgi:hypothetical protein
LLLAHSFCHQLMLPDKSVDLYYDGKKKEKPSRGEKAENV